MGVRAFTLALACGFATVALAQDSGYVRFPAQGPEACATACSDDRMCASWSFEESARSSGQRQSKADGSGLCTFSASTISRPIRGTVSGLPRRQTLINEIPLLSAAPLQRERASRSLTPYPETIAAGRKSSQSAVKAAPLLRRTSDTSAKARGLPQQLSPTSKELNQKPASQARIDYEPRTNAITPPRQTLVVDENSRQAQSESHLAAFRGTDGMIDAAEMRRAQLTAARQQGIPTYSVQREWEAVAKERQRALDASGDRADLLAKTTPVSSQLEERVVSRGRRPKSVAKASVAQIDEIDQEAAQTDLEDGAPDLRSAPRRARGVPRVKPLPQVQSKSETYKPPSNKVPKTYLFQRARAQALDREPRLSGGPG